MTPTIFTSRYTPLASILNQHRFTLTEVLSLIISEGLRYGFNNDAPNLITSISIANKCDLSAEAQYWNERRSWDDVSRFMALDRGSLQFYAEQGHLIAPGDTSRVCLLALPALKFFYRTYVSERALLRVAKDPATMVQSLKMAGVRPLVVPERVNPIYRYDELDSYGRGMLPHGSFGGRVEMFREFLHGDKYERFCRQRCIDMVPRRST
jgi:hypothetical protein